MQFIENIPSFWLRTILFAIFLVNGILYIPKMSVTYDEGNHLNYAVRFVKGQPEKIKPYDDASTMPVSALNTIPRVIEELVKGDIVKTDNGEEDIIHGRYITLLVSLLIGWYIYKWSKELYGEVAGLFSLCLFCFCPNITAHANLFTTDAYSALFTIVPLYHFWRYINTGSGSQFIYFTLALGFAQLAKQSLTYLYLVFLLLLVAAYLGNRKNPVFKGKTFALNFLLVFLINITVINVGFQLKDSGKSLEQYAFRSDFFNGLKNQNSVFSSLPLPLPSPYLYGLDYTKHMDEMGGGANLLTPYNYLLGEKRKGQGFPYYYLVVLFFKTPVTVLVFLFLSLILLFRKPAWSKFIHDEIHLVLPVVFFLVYFNLFYHSQVGIRHILPIFPLIYVLCGFGFMVIVKKAAGKLFITVAMAYQLLSFYFYYPHLVPYTNEFLPDKKMAYKIMGDSNLDFGHGNFYLEQFLLKNPSVKQAPEIPTAGKFIIPVNSLLDISGETNYSWLRGQFTPVDHFIFSYLLFEVSEEDLAEKALK